MAEYVDKQKARDLFQQKCYNVSDRINSVEVGMFVEGIMQVLDEATAADVQLVDRWISVDETLPVYNSRVLVYDVSKNSRIGIYTEIGWCSQYENPLMYKVTHWQPLPEPPKPTE